MTTRLVKNAEKLVTMDAARREIKNGALLVEDNRIEWVGPTPDFEAWAMANRPDLV